MLTKHNELKAISHIDILVLQNNKTGEKL